MTNEKELAKIIVITREIEDIIKNKFKVTGKGLHKYIELIQNKIPEQLKKDLKFIATIRNQSMHNRNFKIDNFNRYKIVAQKSIDELNSLTIIDNTINILSKLDNFMDEALIKINKIKNILETNKDILSNEEKILLNKQLHEQRLYFNKIAMKYEQCKFDRSNNIKELKKPLGDIVCPNCKGIGGFDIVISASVYDMMWYDDGEFYSLAYKECVKCDGRGKI